MDTRSDNAQTEAEQPSKAGRPTPKRLLPGLVRSARRPADWKAPGPRPAGAMNRPDLAPRADEDLCFLSGDWRIFQRRSGHRWSVDDLVTAWVATRSGAAPYPALVVDLGCGIGTVLMLVAWRFPNIEAVGCEAQPHSAELARRSLMYNGAADRCTVLDGDFRQTALPRSALVTGTPPYFLRGHGVESESIQKAPCRFEHRGGVEAYMDAAARILLPGGRFVMCAAPVQAGRVLAHLASAGLCLKRRIDVLGRSGGRVRFSVYVFGPIPDASGANFKAAARSSDGRGTSALPPTESICVRDGNGQWTPEFARVREEMGLPPPQLRAPASPLDPATVNPSGPGQST